MCTPGGVTLIKDRPIPVAGFDNRLRGYGVAATGYLLAPPTRQLWYATGPALDSLLQTCG